MARTLGAPAPGEPARLRRAVAVASEAVVEGHRLVEYLGLTLLVLVVPGPSVLFTVGRAVSYGRRAAVATVAGNSLGIAVQVLAVALGLGAVVAGSAAAFTTVKLVGAAYLAWLGWQSFRHRHQLAGLADDAAVRAAVPLRRMARDGLLVGLGNPKAAVFFVAVLPQFVEPHGLNPTVQMLVLGLGFAVLGFCSDSVWGLVAGTARAWLARNPRRLAAVGGAGGLAIVGLGVRLALSGRDG
jgi:threonine/homoserine/homoserine lactone efflux protein